MKGYILRKKAEKNKSNYFYLPVFVSFLFGKVVDKEVSCKFQLDG